MKPDFALAQDTATKLLLEQNIDNFFVDIRNFYLRDDIIIDTVQHYSGVTGVPLSSLQCPDLQGAFTIKKYGKNIVLYDDDIPNERRKHWGIVHEVGHIYLGHKNDNQKEEIEAHFFAAQLLAPEIVLIELARLNHKISAMYIYDHFNLSYESAQKRIVTLRNRGCWNSGAIDKALLEKYKPLIHRSEANLYAI